MPSSSSYSETYDLTSGQDAAHKAGQERSVRQAGLMPSLYKGSIEEIFDSANRIRDLKKYLAEYGADPSAIEVIPRSRLAQQNYSQQLTIPDPPRPNGG
jgi:hypothetical protein